jgi:hypothetical protein
MAMNSLVHVPGFEQLDRDMINADFSPSKVPVYAGAVVINNFTGQRDGQTDLIVEAVSDGGINIRRQPAAPLMINYLFRPDGDSGFTTLPAFERPCPEATFMPSGLPNYWHFKQAESVKSWLAVEAFAGVIAESVQASQSKASVHIL